MREFCAGQPNADVIPLSVIGHENPMIYDWSCKGKKPAIARQIFTVDARGFPAELWKEIAPAQKPAGNQHRRRSAGVHEAPFSSRRRLGWPGQTRPRTRSGASELA